ncbi:MAG: DJ-1/PfpI family protein [Oscillospiraceae bacterium]|nr:DJ-1/PfpI family protein [Oscillospiraceae bacterium]
MVYIILGKGFEEAEAIVPCDMLRRAGVNVRLAGIGGREIVGGHGITVCADCVAEETDLTAAEMIVLPGGMCGVSSILGSKTVLNAVKTVYDKGGYAAAICAGPTVLAKLGITDGKRVTCYPGCEINMGGAKCTEEAAVIDGKVVTGKAPGTAYDFAFALIEVLRGKDAAKKVAAGAVYR